MKALRIEVSGWQRKQLRRLQVRPPSPRVGRRATCLLLSAAGASSVEIRRATGFSIDAITDIRRRFNARGMRSLKDGQHPGRPPRITAGYCRELRRALRRPPLVLGYVFTTWSIARLGTHLAKRTGIGISRDWLRRLVHQHGYRCGRPKHTLRRKRALRGSRIEYRRAQKRLESLKKGHSCLKPTTSCGISMKASSTCTPISRDAG
jgi:transposase